MRSLSLLVIVAAAASLSAAECVDFVRFPLVTGAYDQGASSLQFCGPSHLVGHFEDELVVFDVANPAAPQHVAGIGYGNEEYLRDVAICGTTAYCVMFDGSVHAADLANPAFPVDLGVVSLGGNVAGAGGDGYLLAVVTLLQTWALYDITSPLAPVLLYEASLPFPISDVTIEGDRACVRGLGWQAYDLADPAAPALIAGESFDHYYGTDYAYGTSVQASVRHGDDLVQYVDQWERYGSWISGVTYAHQLTLRVVDVSTPGSPVVLAQRDLGTSSAWPEFLYANLVVDGDRVFAQRDAVVIHDATDLTPLAALGGASFGDGLAVRDDRVYGADQMRLTAHELPSPLVDNQWPVALSTAGTGEITSATGGSDWFAVVSSWSDEFSLGSQLLVYDPATSLLDAAATYGGEWSTFADLCAVGSSLYLTDASYLYRVDVTDPANPGPLQPVAVGADVRAVAAGPGSLVALARSGNQIHTYDVADPSAPILLGSLSLPPAADSALLWSGDLLLVADENGLRVVSVANPSMPVSLATLALGDLDDVHAAGDARVVVGDERWLYLVDLADPSAPELVATSALFDDIGDVLALGEVVYLANGSVTALRAVDLAPIGSLVPSRAIAHLLPLAGGMYGVGANAAGAAELPLDCGLTPVDDARELPSIATAAVAAHPNPFNPQTTIAYTLPAAGRVSVAAFDLRGREVRRLVDGTQAAGDHQVVWNGRDDAGRALPSGAYLLRCLAGREVATAKVLLLE